MNDKSPRRQAEDFLKSTSKELLVLAALVTEAIGIARTAIEHGVVLRSCTHHKAMRRFFLNEGHLVDVGTRCE